MAVVLSHASAQTSTMCVQAERKAASEDIRYRALLWTWVGLHCGMLALCADAVHEHNMHPLACLGQHLSSFMSMTFRRSQWQCHRIACYSAGL